MAKCFNRAVMVRICYTKAMRTTRAYRPHKIKTALLANMPGLMISQRSRLMNQFGFLSGRLGMAYRWQLRGFGQDRRTLFQRLSPAYASFAALHPNFSRWGMPLTKTEMDMATELEQSAQAMVNNSAQIEREMEQQLAPLPQFSAPENSLDISETARQAFARMDLLMEKWQLRALDLNRRMSGLNQLSPHQMMMAATMKHRAITAFDARLAHSPIPSSFAARQRAAARTTTATAATMRPLPNSPREMLQRKIKAMYSHTEQLSEDLGENRRNFDRRTQRRNQQIELTLKPKPKLIKPTTGKDKEDA